MHDFGQLISQSVFRLSLLKKKILKPDSVLSKGLLCDTKRHVLETYLTSISNLTVLVGSIAQLLPIMKNIDDVNIRVANAKKGFKKNFIKGIITEICNSEHCSGCPKSSMLFSILQGQLEDIIFEEVSNTLIRYIGSQVLEEQYDVCEEILDMIYDFAEAAMLHLSGLRINCMHIKNTIFDDERFDVSNSTLKALLPVDNDPILDMPPGTCLYRDINKKECLHLFLCDDFFKIKNWMDVYINLYKDYHIDPKKISLVLDYKLMEENVDWTEDDFKRYLHAREVFGKVYVINCEHINLGKYEQELEITSIDVVEECVIYV